MGFPYRNRPKKKKAARPADPSAEELTGVVHHIVYHSSESGYTVCVITPTGSKDEITVVGNCQVVWEGETLLAKGTWIRHKQHGYQFKADSITCAAPVTALGIERYLASGLIKGIGKVMAKRLVKAFKDDTLRIIDKESAKLLNVEGIGNKRKEMIKQSWNDQKTVRDIMIFMQGHGIGTAQATRIHKRYGDDAIALVTENPYRLCRDVWGIGFKTADAIATSLGVPPHSTTRARAGLMHVLRVLTDEGHCYCPRTEFIENAECLLDIPTAILEAALDYELNEGSMVEDHARVYPASLFQSELTVAKRIAEISSHPPQFQPINVEKAVPWAEERMKISFAPQQHQALRISLSEKVSIITGGPGVGKTTIIQALVDVFQRRKLAVELAAPTGRAAKRLEESTSAQARTLHRMLKFRPATGDFEHGSDNPVKADIFILDEVSMVDISLMSAFLKAIPDHACLVLVGDKDQLPSVGPGTVLRDLIASEVVPCTTLDMIFRQEKQGLIVHNAHLVNRGEQLEIPNSEELLDFYFVEADEPDDVLARVMELATRRIPERFGFNPMTEIQILTPMRKNQLGADNLNVLLQQALNPSGTSIMRFGKPYRVGDRVMQIRNNYDKEVFNGDIGIIRKIDTVDQTVGIEYDRRIINYELSEIDEVTQAYACSIHKSQGSEYPAVIILMATQHFKLLQRNLLYTAITRGRKLVCLVGSRKAVNIAIRNNEIRLRRTGLKARLQETCR